MRTSLPLLTFHSVDDRSSVVSFLLLTDSSSRYILARGVSRRIKRAFIAGGRK